MICRPQSSALKLKYELTLEYRINPDKLVFSYFINILILTYYYYYYTTHTQTHLHTILPYTHIALSETIMTSRSRIEHVSTIELFVIIIFGILRVPYIPYNTNDATPYIPWYRPWPSQRFMTTHRHNA